MRKSARMLKVGMTVIIHGKQQTITHLDRDDTEGRVIITCGDDVYTRTTGAKIDVVRTS